MRLLKTMLLLLALLAGSAAAKADYNPTNPPEPGVNFTLTTRCTPQDGCSSISGGGTYAFGTSVNLYVYANTGYRFTGWKDEEGNVLSTNTSFYYTMPTKDVTLTATFVYDPSNPGEPSTPVFKKYSKINFEIYPKDGGSFSGNYGGKYEVGSNQRFYVNVNSGYRFINWTRDGEVVGTSTTLNYTVPEGDHKLVANFEYTPDSPGEPGEQHFYRKLKLVANPPSAATLYGAGEYLDGTSHRIYMNVNDYYTFVNWTDENGEEFSTSEDFYLTMPNKHLTLTANYTYNYDPSSPGEPGTPNPGGTITENMVARPRFGMYDNTHVQILCETQGSTIHYTLDGTDPTSKSPVYKEPVYVSSNLLVKAIAYKEGMEDSPIVSYQVTAYKTYPPVFTFENKMVKITSETPDAVIRYTLDFTEPNAESEVYTGPFVPEENCRIKAYASKEGLTDSPVSIYVYRRAEHTLPAPTFSLNGEGKLVITPPVKGGKTYYTMDGKEPTESSPVYTAPITLTHNCTVRAYTTHINYFDSPIADYEVTGFAVPAPAINFEGKKIKITCAIEGAVIRYTINGTAPTAESTVYTVPFLPAGDCTVIAMASKEGMNDSPTTDYKYVKEDHTLPLPTFALNEAGQLVISSAVEGCEIRYTMDGTPPTPTSPQYSAPITLTRNCTVKAYSTHAELLDSPVADYEVNTFVAEAPAIYFKNKMINIDCATKDATIRYTIDGTAPTAESTIYTVPFLPAGDCTIIAMASKEGMNDSPTTDYKYVKADHTLPLPTFALNDAGQLVISSAVEGCKIYYTMDGTAPTASSPLYSTPITLTRNCTVLAYSTHAELLDSPVADYEVNTFVAEAPAIYFKNKMINIDCATKGAVIRYTIDGTPPTKESTLYTGPFLPAGDCTVIAMASKEGMNDSPTTDYKYVKADHTLPLPTFALNEAGQLVISSAVEGCEIRYTMDGTAPTASSPQYSAPITLTRNCTVKAYSTHAELLDSPVADYKVDTFTSDAPTFSFEYKKINIKCAIEGAAIHYTLDNTPPTKESTLYTGPFLPAGDCTVQAIASKDGMNDSQITSYAYRRAEHTLAAPTFALNGEGKLEIKAALDDCRTWYTMNDAEPDTTSTQYTGPITLTRNCTVKAFSTHWNNFDSPVADYVVNTFVAEKPVIYFKNKMINIDCATTEAVIRYTLDGTTPTAGSTIYTEPFLPAGDCTIIAMASKEGMNDSPTMDYEYIKADHTLPLPTFALNDAGQLVISSAVEHCEIHYTMDGTAPTEESPLYSTPITLTRNCTVRAYSTHAELLDSPVADYEVDTFVAEMPVIYFENRMINIDCATKDAVIRYTLGETMPTAESTVYTSPFLPAHDCTIIAIASKEGWHDSPVASYAYIRAEHTLVAPTFALNEEKRLVITPAMSESETLRYTINGKEPDGTSALYEGPIEVPERGSVKAYSTLDNFFDSPVAEYVIAEHKETAPTITADYHGWTITITHPDSLNVALTIDGHTEEIETPGTIDVHPGMSLVTAVAIAEDADRLNSLTEGMELVFHDRPDMHFDGHTVYAAVRGGSPVDEDADVILLYNGDIVSGGGPIQKFDVPDFGEAMAVVISDHAFRSDVNGIDISYFNTGERAGAISGRRLEEAFMWDKALEDYTYLQIVGDVNRDDLEFIGTLPNLSAIELCPRIITTENCDSVLAGSPIETICSTDYPEGMLKGMPRLTTVMWDGTSRMPEGRITEARNPNILLWTKASEYAAADARNIVLCDADMLSANPASGISGTAERIELAAGYPYNAHRPIEAGQVVFIKKFEQPTEPGKCQGWETIVLPFTPERMVHIQDDVITDIMPFATWPGTDDAPRPFWLYTADNGSEWEPADRIEAGVPYIISMPNNPDYIYYYNLAGWTGFMASDVILGEEGFGPKKVDWKGSAFTGTFMPVDASGIRSLNVNVEKDGATGSEFVAGLETLPFGAYVDDDGTHRSIPVFGDSGIGLPGISATGIAVDSPAPGTIRISSMRDCRVPVVSIVGMTIATAEVRAGESVRIEGLTKGIYIVAGMKIMVK